MDFYRIQIAALSSPYGETPTQNVDKSVQLTDEQVLGMAAAAVATFSDIYGDKISITDQSGRLIDLVETLKVTQSVVLDGDSMDLVPEKDRRGREKSWTRTVNDFLLLNPAPRDTLGTRRITKSHTVKANGSEGAYLFQYDSDDFLNGMILFYNEMGLDPVDELVFIHQGDTPLELV